ncbi:hypothetical protein B0H17DRAFT_1130186 [Mycena rosella]|uniref:Uncharacterized protein n=1 Tax=Mycena rosella TaxID=1033263 RepID=A0AAD7DU91_MYCRO|nr:hypothetical protein B0H17DRAFT_1130186 [Mycena rosella]
MPHKCTSSAQMNANYQVALHLALQDEEDQADPLPALNAAASTSTSLVSSSSKLKGKKRVIPADNNDNNNNNEIEVILYHRVIEVEPETPPRQVKRLRLTIQIPAAPSTLSLPSSLLSIPALSASYSTASCDSIPSPGLLPLTANTTPSYITFQASPAAPTPGSFAHNEAYPKYNHRWNNRVHFKAWLAQEQQEECVKLRLTNTYLGMPVFEQGLQYHCSRAGTGGVKKYTKWHPEWEHKIPPKCTDCPCTLLVKQYLGVSTILGNYFKEHNHSVGSKNLWFMRIPNKTQEYIAGLVQLRVVSNHIVRTNFI